VRARSMQDACGCGKAALLGKWERREARREKRSQL